MGEEEKLVAEDHVNKEDGSTSMKRIFLGGLGGGVTEDDIKKTFSLLGDVTNVEIIRTKDRNFAYMDFFPSSLNALSRLFSTYNGCCWKGGKLKLQKAKEHYMVRLRQEWVEDTQQAATVTVGNLQNQLMSCNNPGNVCKKENAIHIYFPKLRKVKSIPYKGTGKHKYSFQRLDVLGNPIHFCDCDEHSYPFCSANEKCPHDSEIQVGGEEDKLMNSVMNKLFSRKQSPTTSSQGTLGKLFKMEKCSRTTFNGTLGNCRSIGDVLADYGKDDSADDGLIINVVGKGSNMINLSHSNTAELQKSEEGKARKTESIQENKYKASDRRRKLYHLEERKSAHRDDIVATNSKMQGNSVQNTSGGSSWQHKLSWAQLFDSMERSSFSIREIIPVPHSDPNESVA